MKGRRQRISGGFRKVGRCFARKTIRTVRECKISLYMYRYTYTYIYTRARTARMRKE